ncbi:MAG: hypothetical protein JWM26_306, partial [Betaproteobacteria bacterium]|nr:hypothetical protein [Betaproteobacteria bacterium]
MSFSLGRDADIADRSAQATMSD